MTLGRDPSLAVIGCFGIPAKHDALVAFDEMTDDVGDDYLTALRALSESEIRSCIRQVCSERGVEAANG